MSEHAASPGQDEDPSTTSGATVKTPPRPWWSRRRRGAAVIGVNLVIVGAVALSARPPSGGEDGASAAASGGAVAQRWGESEFESPEPPAAALREANDFGMIGILKTPAAGQGIGRGSPPHDGRGEGARGEPTTRTTNRRYALDSSPEGTGQGFGSGHGRLGGGAPTVMNTEAYDSLPESGFVEVAADPRSTFSVDVDTASYALVRSHLESGRLPPEGAVRVEEMVNYFDYGYTPPKGEVPFAVHTELADAPWARAHKLLRIGLKGREVEVSARPAASLVFLIDVSGSMMPENKLPLLKRALGLLVDRLEARDKVGIVAYAGASGIVLPPTAGSRPHEIQAAVAGLRAGGVTNGAAGIRDAYAAAERAFVRGGINRVILATDGDFNVGVTSQSELVDLVQREAKKGVFLTVLGFGRGNYKDSTLEKLADKGNGNYAYIDGLAEARKVLVEQASGTLLTIAKDVKLQVEWNPRRVAGYRLIGYENRRLAHQDFRDDRRDAGEVGAGHTVTALYEVVPVGRAVPTTGVDALKYQGTPELSAAADSSELATVKLRYKRPHEDISRELAVEIVDRGGSFEQASNDFRLAATVAAFGMRLRRSDHCDVGYAELALLARPSDQSDERREELARLIERAGRLDG